MVDTASARPRRSINFARFVQPAIGVLVVAFVLWRLWTVLFVIGEFGPETWVRLSI